MKLLHQQNCGKWNCCINIFVKNEIVASTNLWKMKLLYQQIGEKWNCCINRLVKNEIVASTDGEKWNYCINRFVKNEIVASTDLWKMKLLHQQMVKKWYCCINRLMKNEIVASMKGAHLALIHNLDNGEGGRDGREWQGCKKTRIPCSRLITDCTVIGIKIPIASRDLQKILKVASRNLLDVRSLIFSLYQDICLCDLCWPIWKFQASWELKV